MTRQKDVHHSLSEEEFVLNKELTGEIPLPSSININEQKFKNEKTWFSKFIFVFKGLIFSGFFLLLSGGYILFCFRLTTRQNYATTFYSRVASLTSSCHLSNAMPTTIALATPSSVSKSVSVNAQTTIRSDPSKTSSSSLHRSKSYNIPKNILSIEPPPVHARYILVLKKWTLVHLIVEQC
ncbi:ORF180 (chloroplast) [Klebsormidium nitens]|uniref:ORF180 n=1 Tax=Klebsormidium nitens TaxID=105231 RepID=A0A0U9HTC5_KLENI|nr:ORF180 [Klebsormidium nitens]|eukprot:GAQ93773.1 ORF180 (chloroplast) [Klebsormidium nitens]